MKRFYRLLNYEFSLLGRAVILLGIGMMLSPVMLVNLAMSNYSPNAPQQRFEEVYAASGSQLVFFIYMLVFALVAGKTFYANYWGAKGIYTIMTLPVRREAVYWSRLLALFTGLLLLVAAQSIGIWLSYERMVGLMSGSGGTQFVMHNGLFLAAVRSEFIRLVLPLTASEWLSSLCMLLCAATGLYYALLCERSRRYWGSVPLAAALLLLLVVYSKRMAGPMFESQAAMLYWNSLWLLLLTGWFVWHGQRLVRRGAIA
ncbi:hypothetical protein EBB07_08975 [Paenibacillaceae bacterium]|nr:hypothetical protein EBB07_08975 [Paenibacillaceae bacterium]